MTTKKSKYPGDPVYHTSKKTNELIYRQRMKSPSQL